MQELDTASFENGWSSKLTEGAITFYESASSHLKRHTFEIKKQVNILDPHEGDCSATQIKYSRLRPQRSFTADIYSVDFRNLLKQDKAPEAVNGIDNLALLHGVAGLYSLSLPDVDHDTLYKCLNMKDSFTILVLLTVEDAKEHCFASLKTKERRKRKKEDTTSLDDKAEEDDEEEEEDSYEEESEDEDSDSESDDKFDGIYSDFDLSSADESEEEDESEDSYEENMNTMDDFIDDVWDRKNKLEAFYKEHQHKTLQAKDIPDEYIGVESRLIACVTCEHYHGLSPEKLLVITLLSTRRKYKGLGVGSLIMKHVRNPVVSGYKDVILVNADEGAVTFFEKQGFSSDTLLNSPYEKVHDGWFNTRRMIRFANFAGEHPTSQDFNAERSEPMSAFELCEMETELKNWRETSIKAHQKLSLNVMRMNNEIRNLNQRNIVKDKEIECLRQKLSTAEKSLQKVKEDALMQRLKVLGEPGVVNDGNNKQLSNNQGGEATARPRKEENGGGTSKMADVEEILMKNNQMLKHFKNLHQQQQKRKISSDVAEKPAMITPVCDTTSSIDESWSMLSHKSKVSSTPVNNVLQTCLDHLGKLKVTLHKEKEDINEREKRLMKVLNSPLPTSNKQLSVIEQLQPAPFIVARFKEVMTRDGCRVEDMIFCGKQLDISRQISVAGFDRADFTSSQFGLGLHFTKQPHHAAALTKNNQLIVCKVILGKCLQQNADSSDLVDAKDTYNSALVVDNISSDNVRYVVFDPSHVLPHTIVRYNHVENN